MLMLAHSSLALAVMVTVGLPSWLLSGLAAVGGLAALFYLGVPLLIYAKVRLNSGDVHEEIDVEELRPEAHAHFAQIGERFVQMGFQPWLTMRVRGYAKGDEAAQIQAMMFANRAERTLAGVAALFQALPNGEKITFQADYSSDTADGLEYNTTNSSTIAESTPDAKVIMVHARGITDLDRLLSLHRQALRGQRLAELPAEDDLINVLNEQTREKLQRKAERGYVTLCADGMFYRPTLLGAYLMTWRIVPPRSWLYWRKHRARVRRLEREGGIGVAA